mgnify:CR=1 FL=1
MNKFEQLEECMGTVFKIAGRSEMPIADINALLKQSCELLHEADRTFSLYKPESPLSRLARGETRVAELPPVVGEIWDECELWEKRTDGWFSAFTPEHTFDPSGLVKTWAARRAVEFLQSRGLTDFTMNAGGDVLITDEASDPSDWKIGLSKPVSIASEDAGLLTVLDLAGTEFRAIATSGSAERGAHIWNPKAPGKTAADELLQVSVIARDLVEADILATASFAEGIRSIDRLNAWPHVEALLVLPDGQLAGTNGLLSLVAK